MAWQVPETGVPYYKPVAPEVPQPDNTAAKIISAGTGPAISGFVQMALGRERAKLEQQQLLQNADVAAKNLKYNYDKLGVEHDIELKKLDAEQESRDMLDELRQSSIDLNREKLRHLKTEAKTALEANMEFQRTWHGYNMKFQDAKDKLGLNDANMRNADPVGFSDAITTLEKQFEFAAPRSAIKDQIKQLRTEADQQKSTIILNGTKQMLSVGQILNGLRTPDTYQDYYDGLKDAGHITPSEEDTGKVAPFDIRHPVDSIWNKVLQKHETKTVEKTDPMAGKLLDSAKIFDPGKIERIIPPDAPRSAKELQAMSTVAPAADDTGTITSDGYDARTTRGGRASPQAVAEAADAINNSVDLPKEGTPEPDPTATDQTIQRARMALAQGKDPAAVKQLLTSKGIDPSVLDEETP